MQVLESPVIELHFPLRGEEFPSDHAYSLYSSISRVIPDAHNAEWLGIHTIKGRRSSQGRIQLSSWAKLRVRLPLVKVPTLTPLAGAKLDIDGHQLRCGIPEIHQLSSSSTLRSRLVIINIKDVRGRPLEPDDFMTSLTKRLRELEIDAIAELEFAPRGERGPFARRVLKVKSAVLPGYGVILRQLTEKDSLRIQELGLGGRRRMGCGLFLPLRGED